ncbi:hypothetical protein MPSEU_000160400 [Mayamaea pseudoterrestris]|nr:hypothetical protein MPSEU_000160400 [Mayamaea pseudoterrestris]
MVDDFHSSKRCCSPSQSEQPVLSCQEQQATKGRMGNGASADKVEAVVSPAAPLFVAIPVMNVEQQQADQQIQADEQEQDDDVIILPAPKKQRFEPPIVVINPQPVLSPSVSMADCSADDSINSSTGLVCLNVRGTKMDVPRATLNEIPWFEALLSRWSSQNIMTKDKDGNLYIDDDAQLFQSLIYHARNVSRPSPLALCLTTPSFSDESKEQEFRLMVDQYGLTEVFYSFTWYQAEWVCTEQAARCEITNVADFGRLQLPHSIEAWLNDKPHVIKTGNKHHRRISAYVLRIRDADKLDWLDFGWVSEATRLAYKVRLHKPRVNEENGRRSISYSCIEEDLNSVGETRMDKDSISINLPEDAGSTLTFRLERERMKFCYHGNLFWSAGETPAEDLAPWIYHCGEEGSAVEITMIELEH